MAEQALLDQIVALVSRTSGVPADRIRPETRLAEDLGVDGDDADELLDAYARRFGVDLAAFEFSRYFGEEPNLMAFAHWVRDLWRGDARPTRPLTIAMLAAAAERGRWVEDGPPAP